MPIVNIIIRKPIRNIAGKISGIEAKSIFFTLLSFVILNRMYRYVGVKKPARTGIRKSQIPISEKKSTPVKVKYAKQILKIMKYEMSNEIISNLYDVLVVCSIVIFISLLPYLRLSPLLRR